MCQDKQKHLFYANYYIALFYEASQRRDMAKQFMEKAVQLQVQGEQSMTMPE